MLTSAEESTENAQNIIPLQRSEGKERKGNKEKNGNMEGAKNASLRSSIAGMK